MRADQRAGMNIDFGAVVDALPGLVWITQADGRSDFVNRGWREYTGLGLDEAIDYGWQRAIHPDDLTSFIESWDRITQSGSGQEIDARLRRFDGQYRWFVFRPSPLAEDSGYDSPQPRWCWLGSYADESAAADGRLRRLLDAIPLQIGFLNTSMILEFANLKSLQDFNMTFEQLNQWTSSGIIHADDHEKNYKHVRALLSGQTYQTDLRFLYPNGAYRWMQAVCVPMRDAHGNVVCYVSCQVDIDDLKRAEALLAAEVQLLAMVAQGEALDQVLSALARHAEELCNGCSCSVLMVAPDRKHLHIAAGPSLPDVFHHILDGQAIDGGYDPCSLAVLGKTPIVTEDLANDPRWEGSPWKAVMNNLGFGSCRATPIPSASGEVSGVVAIYRSTTVASAPQEEGLIDRFAKIAGIAIDRADADAALQARERELREALAQLSEGQRLSKTGSFSSDIQQDRHRWSDEFYRIFEIDRATPPRLDAVRDRIHPEDLPVFNAEMHRRLEGAGGDFNFRVVTPNGGLKYLRGVSQVREHIGERPIFMGTIQDVTESKVAEEALNRARSELAHVARVATLNAMTASIAHEVSQPLAGIMTNANTCVRMLAANPPNLAIAAETARRTIRDANRATEVIQRLRAMFSTKTAAMELADLNELAREVIALSMGELRRANALLETDFADGLPRVKVDRVQLQQVILNLLLNAADAMSGIEDRPRTLLVQTGLNDDGKVKLLVRDSGTGIDPAIIDRLFEAFYTTKAKGMGVGLSISKSIITRHGGRLWAEDNEGPGATFAFSIPSAPVHAG
ncbi:MAG TPA: PAS domain-containing protein [Bryobacteraceae bacterium]|nr:PAS domain-containing protein [Bryobacteraceae bacterium]